MNIRKVNRAAVIAAAYAAVTLAAAPVSFGPMQLRLSEALCVLPWFFPESAWGLFVGCVLANLIGGGGIADIVFGSAATLIAALATSKIKNRWLACLQPVIFNSVIVGAVLAVAANGGFWVCAGGVFVGEALVMYLLGLPLTYLLPKLSVFKHM